MIGKDVEQLAFVIADRRFEPRLTVRAAVLVDVGVGLARRSLRLCQLFNISSKGLCVRLDRRLPEGQVIDLQVQFPGIADALKIQGRCRWNELDKGAFYVGLEILSEDQKRAEDYAVWCQELLMD